MMKASLLLMLLALSGCNAQGLPAPHNVQICLFFAQCENQDIEKSDNAKATEGEDGAIQPPEVL
jgi:hypothetical protein